jgi:tetratricopeptide (TPR) repeat protein
MKRLYLILAISALSLATFAADWDSANQLYAEGNYADAAEQYRAILEETPRAEVYYNLGNAEFKQGEIARAILAYERALRLKPNYPDCKHNLQFAQAKIIDNIEDNHRFFLAQWAEAFRNLLSEATWFQLSVVLFFCFLICAFLFAFGRSIALRKTGFHLAWITLLCSVVMLCCAASLHHRDTAREEAIIVQGIVNAKSSPDKSGTDLFILHEGTKVWVGETVNGWCNIHVGDNIGWITNSALERI